MFRHVLDSARTPFPISAVRFFALSLKLLVHFAASTFIGRKRRRNADRARMAHKCLDKTSG